MENRFYSVDWQTFRDALMQPPRSSVDLKASDAGSAGAMAVLFDEDGNEGRLFDEGKAAQLDSGLAASPYVQSDVAAVMRSLTNDGIHARSVDGLLEISIAGVDAPRRQDLPGFDDRLSDAFAVIGPETAERWLSALADPDFDRLKGALERAAQQYDTGLKDPQPSDRIRPEQVVQYRKDWITMLRHARDLQRGIVWFML